MGVHFYWLVLGTLAVWRMSHLLAVESGPWDLVARLRQGAGAGFWGTLLGCLNCVSLWVAAPFAWLIGEGWKERLLLWLSFSGAAILLERVTVRGSEALPSAYVEDQEGEHVLRQK
ncbi:MAG TPA: hypothetical protein VMT86_05370 [Bryobacteraceae bacterium]|nr:hypothetical protein [Bryobacteraceae bacterium]